MYCWHGRGHEKIQCLRLMGTTNSFPRAKAQRDGEVFRWPVCGCGQRVQEKSTTTFFSQTFEARKPAPRQWPLLLRLANPTFSCLVVYHKLLPPCSALSNKHDELLGHWDQTTWPQLFCTCVWVSFLLSFSCCPYSGSPNPNCVRTWQFKMV